MKCTEVLKKFSLVVLFFVLALGAFVSCKQDSIFADIAVEPPPTEPRIAGTSTNIVVLDDKIYMASIGSSIIHTYHSGEWGTLSSDGKIAGLASTTDKLYALIYSGKDRLDASISEYNGTDWTVISKGDGDSYSLQSIYSAGERLFAGGKNGSSWDIFQVNDGGLTRLISDTAPLTGAAFSGNDYYIATGGKGVYRVSSPGAAAAGSEGNITGIANVAGTITAVTWDGRILVNSGTEFITISSEDLNYTGAMNVYKEVPANSDSLLLLGVQTIGSYNKGYRELALMNGKMPTDGRNPVIPGGGLSSVRPENKSKYEASLARYSVHHILQVPAEVDPYHSNAQGWEPLIFASTAGNGVYVLMNGLWNAQE